MSTSGELIYEQKAKITTITVNEFTPDGVRLQQNIQGTVKGKVNGIIFMTSTQLWKPDGTRVGEGRGVITTADGERVLITWGGRGSGSSISKCIGKGELTFQTSSTKLSAKFDQGLD